MLLGGNLEISNTLRNIIEIGFGLVYLIGAIFNSVFTLRHGEEFYGSFVEGAWFVPSRLLVQNIVLPYSKLFTILLIVFQLFVAISILSRGILVKPGLIAGAAFTLAAAMVSNIPGAIANLALATVQLFLAFTR
jgi:hypothetical protein